jgi:hypothetical protein
VGFFGHGKAKRKETDSPYRYSTLEEYEQEISRCEQEISHIERRKRDLERRLEILTQAKPSRTVFVTDDSLIAPTTPVEREIEHIMDELRLLDLEEESCRLSKGKLERAKPERIGPKKVGQDNTGPRKQRPPVQIHVKPIHETKDLWGEVIIEAHEAVLGGERHIQYSSDGDVRTLVVKIPRGVAPGTKIRYRGLGSRGNPPGDLFLIVRIAEHPLGSVA